jgi:hypothetical protein
MTFGEPAAAPLIMRLATMTDSPPEAPEEPKAEAPHVAKVGVVDKGKVVTGFGGEPINGMIADLADGDD